MEEKIIVQDVEIIKKEVNILEEIAKQLVINNDKDLEESSENLSKVKKVGKIIKERREEITKPMLASLSSVRQLFKPIEETCENVEKIVKEKIKIYLDNQNANIDINGYSVTSQPEIVGGDAETGYMIEMEITKNSGIIVEYAFEINDLQNFAII